MNNIESTLGIYGEIYQLKLLNEILTPNNKNLKTNNLFFDEIIKDIKIYHFKDKTLKNVMSLIKRYYRRFKKQPTINSISLLVKSEINNNSDRVKTINTLQSIENINTLRRNNVILNDTQTIKIQLLLFIERQKMLKTLNKNS